MESPVQLQDLVQQARAGDRVALESVFQIFRARLRSWIEIRLGQVLRTKIEVDDVMQETLVRAQESLPRFEWRGEESFLYWLTRIAENVILGAADRVRRRREASLEVEPEAMAATQSKAHRREERFDRLQRALEALEPDHRRVILLSRLEGLPLQDVARRMNRTPNAVSHLLLRALRKLKEGFGDTESLQLPRRSLKTRDTEHDG